MVLPEPDEATEEDEIVEEMVDEGFGDMVLGDFEDLTVSPDDPQIILHVPAVLPVDHLPADSSYGEPLSLFHSLFQHVSWPSPI